MAKEKKVSDLDAALKKLRRYFYAVGAFSFVINLLMLTPSIYMLQACDRVLSSRNQTTLPSLTPEHRGVFAAGKTARGLSGIEPT